MHDSFAKVYSSKSDDELLALAVDPGSLVEEANRALEAELERRNLEKPLRLSESRLPRLQSESRWGPWRTLRLASGVAVFVMSALFGAGFLAAFLNAIRHNLITARNLWVMGGAISMLTILAFTGAYFLVISAVKSK